MTLMVDKMKNLIAVNTQIAGIKKNDLIVGGFKLLHISNTVNTVVWEKDIDGTAKAKRDEFDKVVRKQVPGYTLSFAYKNQSKSWVGQLVDVNGELLPTKSCLKVEILLPKQLNTQSKLYKFLIMLGEIEPIQSEINSEDDLLDDTEELGELNENDLLEDTENTEDVPTLDLEDIHATLLNYVNKIFIAPFTLQDNGYPKLSNNFSNWEMK